jgi:hypothetical protein
MPVSTQTRAVSPVTLARHSARGRLLRRVVALGALGLFVAGMLVAAGFGALVVTALPAVAAAVIAAGAAWLLWRSRPWRIARPVARTVAHVTAAVARSTERLTRATGSSVARALTNAPTAFCAAATRADEFLARVRGSLTAVAVRTIPVRQEAYQAWRALAAELRRRMLGVAVVCMTRVRVAVRRDADETLPGPSGGGTAARRAVARVRRPR